MWGAESVIVPFPKTAMPAGTWVPLSDKTRQENTLSNLFYPAR